MVFKSILVLLPFLILGVLFADPSLEDEADAMEQFKNSIVEDPTGAIRDWNSGSIHHCNWTGIECDRASGRVVSISIQGKKLEGEVSQFLGRLSSLKFLDLSRNSFTGNIPSQFQYCFQLVTINLSANSLSGPIPWQLGKLQNLKVLHLEHNHLSDTIPESLCDCHSLIEIHLQENSLIGTIPDTIGNLKALVLLDLSHNQLSGIIPAGKIAKISTLKYLDLSFNQLEGPFPNTGIFRNTTGLRGNPSLCITNKTKPCTYSSPLTSSMFPKDESPSNHSHHHTSAATYASYAIVYSLDLILILTLGVLCCRHFRKQKVRDVENAQREYTPRIIIKRFCRKELEDATDNFSKGNILGTSQLSTVYKGRLANGMRIAVKNLNFREHSAQSIKSFQREMETLGMLRHRNLLKVIGYAWESQRIKAVVLQYMKNGNLDTAIHNSKIYESRWNLYERVKVFVSVSRGLFYLHTGYDSPIVHCDLKPSNILLDDEWNAHVSDFGTARILGAHLENGASISSASALVGTIGYLAPELAYIRKVTTKVDVFSFGVVVMEFITRKRPTGLIEVEGTQITLRQLVDRALSNGNNELIKIVDPYLIFNFSMQRAVVEQVLKLALACTSMDPKDRPDMNQVLDSLLKISDKVEKLKSSIL